jgi:hypothetical protein
LSRDERDGRTRFEAELRAIRERAQLDLRRLDDERRSLRRLITVADRHLGTHARRKKQPPRASKPEPLGLIREHPGIRASMVARLTGRDADEVAVEIQRLESTGQVRRTGLGWTAAP